MPAAYCTGGGVCGRKWGEDTLIKSFNDLFLISIFQALESAVHMLFPPGCSWQRSWWIWSFRLLPFCEEPENTAIFSMLPRPAAVCYWMVIPWLQACVPSLTGWECACPGVSAQAKLIAANFKFYKRMAALVPAGSMCCFPAQISLWAPGPFPTCAVTTPGAVMVLFGATLSLENVSVGLLCTALELSCALCWAFNMLEPELVPAGKLCLVA